MSSKKIFNKKTAQTFQLVHRSHDDPLYFNGDSTDRVLVPIKKHDKKTKERLETKDDLQKELDAQIQHGDIRKNEGEAAIFGITYDDSQYDYMQHLRSIGDDTQGIFIANEANAPKDKKNQVMFKEDIVLPDELLPSKEKASYDYQRQQNIPDAISGFKPDLAPDLREALEALEDEAYIDGDYDIDDIDVFDQLLSGNKQKEISLNDYDGEDYADDDDDEWDMDNYEDEYEEYDSGNEGHSNARAEANSAGNFDWEKDFGKFKKAQSRGKIANDWDSDDEFGSEDEQEDALGDLPDLKDTDMKSKSSKKKEKRKKGALTDTSSYSMSSSALCRTEQMTIIDDKFDVMKDKYLEEEEDDYQPFDFKNERADFADMIDNFLDNYKLEKGGRKVVKKDPESERIQRAADSVSKSKLALKRKKESQKKSAFAGLTKDMGKMNL
ncbi:hypothetical protein CANARDRAFT_26160 [[Candida] arabinofermentans NRRL YB-2248]|uniref:Low temperature viability protein n=1 Tax=[Candida] arabinofermentans NRRL YB-2248 TaxID=983967 RepID=A0A1E4T8A3_9ASCO|nr:hypothetical protein CANARDRAFT_26160 [[Candida] arabinofermentans NRRL YB-2248]